MKNIKRLLLITILFVLFFSTGCVSLTVANSKSKMRSFVREHIDELDAVICEVNLQYADELRSDVVSDIKCENLKDNCPAVEGFFSEYADKGFSTITILPGRFIELIKTGATGNPWTYVGIYYSPNGVPYSFFDGEIIEKDDKSWEETQEGTDNYSQSELILDKWYVFVLYY